DLRSTGYTMDTLEAALWCFLHASGVEEAVALAANLGGDADTVAAVTGGLAGVHWGIGAVPRRWLMRIGERELKEVAADLAAVREGEMAGCALGR
ncbi:MAG: ADP-ribosylglycohydrolase family protein, partial [Thermaerobacter sp.]|nr:ADP-ribosylglycohydrolase family protein [Thermaerobacter sp.]